MTQDADERRIYDDEERKLIEGGRMPEAKVRWTDRYVRSTSEQRMAMFRNAAA